MKKSLVFGIIFFLLVITSTASFAKSEYAKSKTIKNKLFSVNIPHGLSGTYEIKTKKDRISIYDKESKKAGFGGFAFGIKAYKNPSAHATLPGSRKIGELKDKKGIIYDMVIKYPTDVQFDYTKGTEPPKSYKNLYKLGENINISGVNGTKYYKGQGMRGQDLYNTVIENLIKAIKENIDSNQLEELEISYMYNVIAKSEVNVLDNVGYAYYDINADGIDELLIGEIAEGNWKGVIYDIYTMVDREPKHVISGGARDRYYVCNNNFLCNEYSSGAAESGVIVYILIENSTEIFPQVSFKYDAYTNKKKPWFISYGIDINNNEWENVDEQTFIERKEIFERYNRFDFIPLSQFNQ